MSESGRSIWNLIFSLITFLPELVNNKSDVETTNFSHPSIDSGLTIPISQKTIRPWFNEV